MAPRMRSRGPKETPILLPEIFSFTKLLSLKYRLSYDGHITSGEHDVHLFIFVFDDLRGY
jgi:hypothetical protein